MAGPTGAARAQSVAPSGGARGGRAARGTRGGGRGRGGAGGRGGYSGQKQRIGGQEVSWDHDPELEIDDKPREMFPDVYIPLVAPPTAAEKAQVAIFRRFRRHVREGPLYTVSGDSARVNKSTGKSSSIVNPFEDMPSYTQKYKPPAKILPNFATRKYCLKLFPEELWDVIEPKRQTNAPKPRPVQKTRTVENDSGKAQNSGQKEGVAEDEGEQVANEAEMLEQEDEEGDAEQNPEDDFSDADSEMGGDYNAEQYFDAGDADGDDYDEGGGDEGGFD